MNNCTLDKVFLEAKTRMLTITEYVVFIRVIASNLSTVCLKETLRPYAKMSK